MISLRRRGAAGASQQLALQLLAFRCALLHEVGALDGLLQRRDQRDRSLRRQRHARQARVGAPRVRDHLADLPVGLGVRIVQAHVDAVQREARGPAAADHPAAEEPDVHSDVLRESEALAHVRGAEDADAHALEDRDGACARDRRSRRGRRATGRCCPRGRPARCPRRARPSRRTAAACGRSRTPRRLRRQAGARPWRAASRGRRARRRECPCTAAPSPGPRSARRG